MRHPIRRLTRSPCLALLALLSSPIAAAGLKALTPAGCFSSSETFELSNIDDFQTDGLCQEACVALKKPVMGLRGGDSCWCGDLLPAADSLVDDHDCDFDCVGFPDHKCTCGPSSRRRHARRRRREEESRGRVLTRSDRE